MDLELGLLDAPSEPSISPSALSAQLAWTSSLARGSTADLGPEPEPEPESELQRHLSHVTVRPPPRQAAVHSCDGTGPLATRTVLDQLDNEQQAVLEDCGLRGAILRCAQDVELPLSHAEIERTGATLTVTVSSAVHPDSPIKGQPLSLTLRGGAQETEAWQREIQHAVEQASDRHWGVSKSFIREEYELWRAESDDPDEMLWTYMDRAKARMGGRQIAVAEFIVAESDSSGRRKVGTATVFVSHVWKMATREFFEVCLEELGEDDYAWIDLYLHNQYSGTQSTAYLIQRFDSLVGGIGRVIAIVTDWEDPVLLKRIWCLFELNSAIDTGADLTFVASTEQRMGLSLNLADKFRELDDIVNNIDVRKGEATVDADRVIFLEKLDGMIDRVNDKLRRELRRWLANSAEAVATRTNPHREALDEAAMALEVTALGKAGAAQTRLIERYPRLPASMLLLSYSCFVSGFCWALSWCIPDGDFFPVFGDSWHLFDIPNASLFTIVCLLFSFETLGRLSRHLEQHQLARQLRAPPLFPQVVVRHRMKMRTLGVVFGVALSCALVWLAAAVGFRKFSGWQIAVPVTLACAILAFLVQMTLEIAVDAAVSRASLLVKVGWLRLSLGEINNRSNLHPGAAIAMFWGAHAELMALVGTDDPVSGYVAAPGYARVLCESGRTEEALRLVAEVDDAATRGQKWSPFDIRRANANQWKLYGCLVRANMAAAVRAPDVDVMGLLSEAAGVGCSTPAGSRVQLQTGKGTLRTVLVTTEPGQRCGKRVLNPLLY